MTFVDKFHDLVNQIPRKIVRTTKLLKTVEESSKEKELNLRKQTEKFLQKCKFCSEILRIFLLFV